MQINKQYLYNTASYEFGIINQVNRCRSSCLDTIEEFEISTIKETVKLIEFYKGHCYKNVAKLLEKIPYEIAKKMKVVLVTHEFRPVKYYDSDYQYHVFLICSTKYGVNVIDPANPHQIISKSDSWLSSVFQNEDLGFFLMSDRMLRFLPLFRYIEANNYLTSFEKEVNLASGLLTPNLTIKHHDLKCLNLSLWYDSYLLNLFETFQLFTGVKTYVEIVESHIDGLVSPNFRINNDEIRQLKDFLKL